MSTESTTKINRLLNELPPGTVLLSSWLTNQGYNLDLQQRYKKSHWLKSIGTGALIRSGDMVEVEGGVYALQKQSELSIHPGGVTALSMLGKSHYLPLSNKIIYLFGNRGESLPAWFKIHDWGLKVNYFQSSFLPSGLGINEYNLKTFSIKISGSARALMECLYLSPQKQNLIECFELMEGLNDLRPSLVQELLEACKSVKVKRLFLFLAEKAGHDWFIYLDVEKVDLGSGKRSIVKEGIYIPKYKITIPKELENRGKSGL